MLVSELIDALLQYDDQEATVVIGDIDSKKWLGIKKLEQLPCEDYLRIITKKIHYKEKL